MVGDAACGRSAKCERSRRQQYTTGFYTFSGTGGGCARPPTGVFQGGFAPFQIVDPGFGCSTAPSSMRRPFQTSARNRRGFRPRARRAQFLAKCLSPQVFRYHLAFRRG